MVASLKPKVPLPEPRMMRVPDRKYQPKKAELEEEIDMPGMSDEQLREAFARPFQFVEEKK